MMKALLGVVVFPLVLSSCGPSDFERQKLAFEEQKYKDEQAAKVEAARKEEEDKAEQTRRWLSCRLEAVEQFNSDFENWGEPVPENPVFVVGRQTKRKICKTGSSGNTKTATATFRKGSATEWFNTFCLYFRLTGPMLAESCQHQYPRLLLRLLPILP